MANADRLIELFNGAQHLPAGMVRDAYLAEKCGDDVELKAQVISLVEAHESADGFLQAGPEFSPEIEAQLARLTPEKAGQQIGPYKLREQIGVGGFGTVWVAEQERPVRRTVALKIIKLGMDTEDVVARFGQERQALAMMDHPNIAKVFDAGATEWGRPFFVMELVDGIKITDYCDQANLPTADRLALFIKVCHAVQHAHQKGIIHRDLKPSNILVALQDGVPVPKVIDFGVAKATQGRLADSTVYTLLQQMIGTPLYMSPEQAEMNGTDVDTRTDIYTLGVLLYELLTGRTPFDADALLKAGYDEMRRVIREQEPQKPSTALVTMAQEVATIVAHHRASEPPKLIHAIRGDLDWIVMKTLEKDRARRYETANGLAMDLQRHLGDEPIVARPPSTGYRLRKAWRRNRVIFSAALATAAALVIAVAALGVSTFRISLANQETGDALRSETEAKTNLQVNSYFQNVALAHRELSADNLGGALKFLEDCPVPLRGGWEWRYLDRLCRAEPVILQASTKVHGIAFHPDGDQIAAGCGDGTVKIWDLASRKVIQTLHCPAQYVFSLAFRPPDGRCLAAADSDRKMRVWDWKVGVQLFDVNGLRGEYRGVSNSVAFAKDGSQLFADGGNNKVLVRDADDGKELPSHQQEQKTVVTAVCLDRAGGLLATGTFGGILTICNTRTGALVEPRRGDGHTHRISGLCFAPDGRWLVTGSFDRSIKIWDPGDGKLLQSWVGSGGLISAIALSPDGRRLATCGVEDKTVKLWDPVTGREILRLRGHTSMVHGIAFSPDGQRLASSSDDGTIRIWDSTPLRPGERMESYTCSHGAEVWSVAFSPSGDSVASASWDNAARIWDPQSGALLRTLKHDGSAFHVAYSSGGQLATSAYTANRKAVVAGWDPRTGEKLFLLGEEEFPFCGVFDPTGEYLLREGKDNWIKVLNARTLQEVGVFGHHRFNIWAMTFSPDGKHLATGSSDGFIRLWPWNPGQIEQDTNPLWTAPGRALGYGERVAFSPNGDRIFAGGDGNTVQILDSKTGHRIADPLTGHTGEVWAVAMDRQGRWLASAGEDTTIRIWDAKTGKSLRTLRGHTGFIMSLAFSPDGGQLVSGSRDRTVKFWETARWIDPANP
ncbi:MAG: protein kinase [Verrucomicrobiota bacterium]